MPSLRNKSVDGQSSQEQASVPTSNQHDNSPNKSNSPTKIKNDRPNSPDEPAASPRRLRDRRLLAGLKLEASANSQQVNGSPVKLASTVHKTDNPSRAPSIVNSNQSTKRTQPSTPTNETQQPPKRSASKSESLLARVQPNTPKSSSTPKPSGSKVNCQKNDTSGLNLTTNKSNKTAIASKNVVVPMLAGQETQPLRSGSSNPQQSRTNISGKPKQPVRITLPNSKVQSTSFAQQSRQALNTFAFDLPLNFSDFGMTLDQLGAINMTKGASRMRPFNVLIAVTGSVATIKIIELIKKLGSAFQNRGTQATIAIKVVMTENSKHFVAKEELSRHVEVLDDTDEWGQWNKIGDPVLHIELGKWADLCLIAPLDANTMAKLASGICDNLLTCTIRAWSKSKPLIFCPAMNVHMYEHQITTEHLNKLQSFGYQRVDCIKKRLACGDFGMGAMASVDTIVYRVVNCLLESNTGINSSLRIQQPTYPIMTTSVHSSNSVGKYKGVNQRNIILMEGVGNTNQRFSMNSSMTGQTHVNRNSISLNSLYQHQMPPDEEDFLNEDQDVVSGNGPFSSIQASDIVTSLQNLKAIDFGRQRFENAEIDEPDSEPNGTDGDHVQLNGVVQALVSSGSTGPPSSPQLKSTMANGCKTSNVNLTKTKSSAVDPSAFMSSCYNKSRNCFTCVICKNDYKNRKSMSRHLKEQHLQGNIHCCGPCGVSYKRREKLIKHNREHHGIVGPT